MKLLKRCNGWGIYENNQKEQEEYDFIYTVIHPANMDSNYRLDPSDSDMECNSLEEAERWVEDYPEMPQVI